MGGTTGGALMLAGKLVQFLVDVGNLCPGFSTGSLALETCSFAERKLKLKHFTTLLLGTLTLKTFKFLVLPEYP